MFAVREVPQSSTGFSPFDLFFSHKPRGLLDITREAWEEQPCPHRTLIEHVGAMSDRMKAVYPIVREHMETVQRQQQASYNRPAQPQAFKPGDQLLVLVPTVECKFLATWQGPYEVIERICEVNYKVRQPGKRKPVQIYHINLLKKWHARDVLFSCLPHRESKVASREEVQVGPDLASHQRQQTVELLDRNQDFFSATPGHTHVVQHESCTIPGKTVNQRPYRIPEAQKAAIQDESRMVKWNPATQEMFSNLKQAMCSRLILMVPDFRQKFVVQVDASEVDLAMVLSQTHEGMASTIEMQMQLSPGGMPSTPPSPCRGRQA
ncbi:hypothetical protein SKAU_G00412940 [Synaphobranchus kaupii]|uniref:Reverse transcriptase/retrotransposon-derived protein RNase H-like domain-containing protein n=1 Tax=Synaphobranchus kaupii TaxID=118154 RepID=A0A9Q1IB46_SYNKA|nr:hypothetical protein SKAU_G00412940 [Synaphobranchus kaupii]